MLSYVPTLKDLEFATGLARKSSLAVVESISTPLRGWAAWLGALNLVTGAPTAVLPETTREAVERLKSCGNNGFADDYGKRDAVSYTHLSPGATWSAKRPPSAGAGTS